MIGGTRLGFDRPVRRAARGPANSDRGAQLRAMLADRFKLAAHTEMRDRPVYFLMPARADRRLGPSMTPATIDCSGDGDPGARRREAGHEHLRP